MPVLSTKISYVQTTPVTLPDSKATLHVGVGWNDKLEILAYLMDAEEKKGKFLLEENILILKKCIHQWNFTTEDKVTQEINEENIKTMISVLSADDGKALRQAINDILYKQEDVSPEDKKK